MAKALKTVALVAGVAAIAIATGGAGVGLGLSLGTSVLGVSAGALIAVSGIASVGASLLAKGPKVPQSQTDRLSANIDPRAFRKTVLGSTAFPVDVRYEEWSGADQEYCDWIVALASHAIDGVDEIWLNTDLAWSRTTGVTAKYAGYFSVPNIVAEGSPANAFTFASGRWNGSARLTGCAYARLRFKVTGNGKKATSPFSSGIPSRITVIGRGALLYDPRRDSTVPGGSGPMRAGDQSTWRYTADDGAVIGENLALHVLRVVMGWRIRNPSTGEMKLATGSGVPARRLNLASWIVAANLCDEAVNRSAGGTEPRYQGAGVVSEGDDPQTVLDALCAACCGRFRDTGGKLSFSIAHDDLAAAATDDGLTDDDVVGPFQWNPDASLAGTPNIVRGRYVDATPASLYQLIDYPEVRLASVDGQDRVFPLDLGFVESPSQAQRVAKQVLQRKQYQGEFTAPFDIRAWKYAVGDVVPFTFAALGFNRKLFRVAQQELGQGGVCNMTLTVEHPAIYAFDKDDAAPVVGAEPNVYDARRNPLILAINDAATTAEWPGISGTGKPADNATNSRDPASPFGPDGTVGDALKQQADFDAAVIAANKRTDALVQVTIPAVEKAVLEAGDRIADARGIADKARTDIDAEIERARGAEGQLRERIESVAAEGGYDDTAVYAEISRVDRAAISAEAALGERIDLVTATISDGDRAVRADVKQTTDALARADVAFAEQARQIEANLGTVDTRIDASASDVTRAYTDADRALGTRATTLEAAASSVSSSAVYNDNFNFWPDGATLPSRWILWETGGNFRTNRLAPGRGGGQFCVQTLNDVAEVNSGFWQVIYTAGAGKWVIDVTVNGDGSGLRGAGVTLHGVWNLDFLSEPDVNGRVGDSQGEVRSWSKMVDLDGRDQINVHAMHGWSGFGRGVAAKYMVWHRLSLRPATDGEIKAGKADAALNNPGGVLARIKSNEDTLADMPNRYAAASSLSTLEAQVNFAADSGLQRTLRAAIEDRATVIADSKAGAVAETVRVLRGEYNGTVGEVREQRGVLNGLNGKTAAYVRLIADAGGGVAALSLWSDEYGGAWELSGNGRIRGNLLVDGTVTTNGLVVNAVTAPYINQSSARLNVTSYFDAVPDDPDPITGWQEVISVGVATSGPGVGVTVSPSVAFDYGASADSGFAPYMKFALFRDGEMIWGPSELTSAQSYSGVLSFSTQDTPSINGITTYQLMLKIQHVQGAIRSSGYFDGNFRNIAATLFKR